MVMDRMEATHQIYIINLIFQRILYLAGNPGSPATPPALRAWKIPDLL